MTRGDPHDMQDESVERGSNTADVPHATGRFVIGIDLGTSNSALCYVDIEAARRGERPEVRELVIPQLLAIGDVGTRSLLPSARYEAARFEIPEGGDTLPWPNEPQKGDRPPPIVGEAARRLGAKTPVRLIESAKSWLCHGGVNRTAAILPWHAPEGVFKISPVEASASYLAHLRAAWDHAMAQGNERDRLVHQHVVLTVPASFDEIARRLTLEAARRAGYRDVTLLEEPLAAFYAFVQRTGGTEIATGLKPQDRILVLDIGGGTSDFTLIEVGAPKIQGGPLTFTRTAVGDHLLLGGDNMDLALAHALEPKLSHGKRLDPEAWAELKLECRSAKEALFSDPTRDSVPVVVAGRGQKLIGGSMRTVLAQDNLHAVVVDGFFPMFDDPDEAALPKPHARVGFLEYGLPYATEPAITHHIAAFLARHADPRTHALRIDAVLFNGGALKPATIRDRILGFLSAWTKKHSDADAPPPRPLIYDQGAEALELAVARGAAAFGLVREGLGLAIQGGSPRTYFVELGEHKEAPQSGETNARQLLCVAPRGMQAGQTLEVGSHDFVLVTNRPVEFPLFTSTAQTVHAVGEIAWISCDELHALAPLRTVVKFGKQKAGTEVPVRIQARLTEIGTLELSCFSRMSGTRFRLEFQLAHAFSTQAEARASTAPSNQEASAPSTLPAPFGGAGVRPAPAEGEVPSDRLEAAKTRIRATFSKEPQRPHPDNMMKGLEQDLHLLRDEFPLSTIRALGELLLELAETRAQSLEHEARWLNLIGFCLRPGFGYALDDWRVRQLWKIHTAGPVFKGRDPCELNWWILWRRVAGGLSRGPQEELSSILFPLLIPSLEKRAKRRPPRARSEEAVEMWRCAASLEQLSAKARAQLGDALLDLIASEKAPKSALWCLRRIGSRSLLYGPREATVRPEVAEKWATRLMKLDRATLEEAPLDTVIALCRLVGDRQLDLPEDRRSEIGATLTASGATHAQILPLFHVTESNDSLDQAAFGERLPRGLKLHSVPTRSARSSPG